MTRSGHRIELTDRPQDPVVQASRARLRSATHDRDPLSGGSLPGILRDQGKPVAQRCDTEPISLLSVGQARTDGVIVGVGQAGDHGTAFEVDHLRPRVGESLDLGIRPHGDDLAGPDGEGLGSGWIVVHGEDFTIDQNKLCGEQSAVVSGLSRRGGGAGPCVGEQSGCDCRALQEGAAARPARFHVRCHEISLRRQSAPERGRPIGQRRSGSLGGAGARRGR